MGSLPQGVPPSPWNGESDPENSDCAPSTRLARRSFNEGGDVPTATSDRRARRVPSRRGVAGALRI